MNTSKRSKILLSIGLLAGCIGISVGATFALFTSTKTINNHIKTGSFKAGFFLTELKYDQISGASIAEHTEDLTTWTGYTAGEGVDLSIYAGEVIKVEKFCPTMGGYAMFKVSNPGDIPLTYTLEVINKTATDKDGNDVSSQFDDVMTVAITGTSTEVIPVGGSVTTNKLEFNFKSEAGDDWQMATFNFDIQLSATQITKTN